MGKKSRTLGICFVLAFFVGSSNGLAQERIRLAYSAISGAMLTPWVALESGIFKKNALTVELVYIAGGSATAAALLGGDIQVMLANGEVVVRSRLQGSDMISFADTTSTLVFSLMARPEVTKPEDLRGKHLGVSRFGTATHAAMLAALEHLRVPASEVTILQMGGVPQIMAGIEIGACNGTGWIAGRNAAALSQELKVPRVSETEAESLKEKIHLGFGEANERAEDELLFELQKLIFRYDISILKSDERLSAALGELEHIEEKLMRTKASKTHGYVRLREKEAMVEAAKLIFVASRVRQESRLSHLREDYPNRDDQNWLRWVLIRQQGDQAQISTEPIATPLVPAPNEMSP